MSELEQLSKRVDAQATDMREMRADMRDFAEQQTAFIRELTVLNTSMAALQRRQVEKQATWSRFIEIIATAAFVFSAFSAGFAVFH